ncbi:MAG: F0F1 ATP synthase subunit delta [Verrucomicrobiota bacterium]|jgi:F-type H+-transporting ATPase subunit delta
MKITKQARHEARQLFRSCQVNGLLEDNRVREAVRLVIEQKPRGFLPVLSQFERLVKLEVARRTARIESATALPAAFQAQLQADLARTYGGGLNFIFTQNPALLGGVRIQVGGDVYDGSVQARLTALQESFSKNL